MREKLAEARHSLIEGQFFFYATKGKNMPWSDHLRTRVSAKTFTASEICDVTSHYSSNGRYNLGHFHELHESINIGPCLEH